MNAYNHINKSDFLDSLIVEYEKLMSTAKFNRQHGHPAMAEQAMHQAYGIETSAELAGISRELFQVAYKAWRQVLREIEKDLINS